MSILQKGIDFMIIKWKPCTPEERGKCECEFKNKAFPGKGPICDEPVAFCPKLFCGESPCAFFTVASKEEIDGRYEISFPCGALSCPGNEKINKDVANTRAAFERDNLDVFNKPKGR
jgi:hypothetical protein